MTEYRIKITGDKYPTEYSVTASGWGSSIGKAIREWKKRFKGSKTSTLSVIAIRGSSKTKTL